MDRNKVSISVVIPCHEAEGHIAACIDAVKNSDVPVLEIIAVDDCSPMSLEGAIGKKYANLKIIRHDKNRGPGAARNTGVKNATGEYIVFLDSDTRVLQDTISTLVSFLKEDKRRGIVGGRFILENGGRMSWNMGHEPNWGRELGGYLMHPFFKLFSGNKFVNKMAMFFNLNEWEYDRTIRVSWVAEGCCALRRDLFMNLGGFDEKFFMFHEGPDLCRRARDAGYEVWFKHDAECPLLDKHSHTKDERDNYFWESTRLYKKKHSFWGKLFK